MDMLHKSLLLRQIADFPFLLQARSTARATPARSSTALASSSRTGVRSPRSAASCSTTSRPSSKRLDRTWRSSKHTVWSFAAAPITRLFHHGNCVQNLRLAFFSETDVTKRKQSLVGRIWYGGELLGGCCREEGESYLFLLWR